MKKQIVRIVNAILKPFGISVVKASSGSVIEMYSAIGRIKSHNIPLNTIIDIGASNGKWSVEAMKVFPQTNFLAIEPLQERQYELESIKTKNSLFDYAMCVAGEDDGVEVVLNVSADLDGSTVQKTGGEQRSVSARTIDSLVDELGLEAPFLLKFDTHGYELPIIHGAMDTLAKTSIVIMEVYNYKISESSLKFHEMCAFMESLGFRSYDMADPMLRPYDNSLWQMDMFFARSDADMFSYSGYKTL